MELSSAFWLEQRCLPRSVPSMCCSCSSRSSLPHIIPSSTGRMMRSASGGSTRRMYTPVAQLNATSVSSSFPVSTSSHKIGQGRMRWQMPHHFARLVRVARGCYNADREDSALDSHAESEAEESIAAATARPVNRQGLGETKKLVEVAMLAGVTGLAYFMANIIKIEGYIGYALPLPSVIAAMRWGPATAWRTVLSTCFLISVLLGPVRMLTYLFMHGMTAGTMAWMWSKQVPWVLGIGVGVLVRTGGLLAYIGISSWAMNENLVRLLLNNIYSLLDQILAMAGSTLVPSQAFVIGTCGAVMALNGVYPLRATPNKACVLSFGH
mmetsp:Transcript_32456/g.91973  ORF Transcript_32456/g.91973 Transcript_32456/m.91973 type:complete len:324 (+) Transcript_32456:121-1092(+)